jgi:hypothetical protein
MSVDVTDHATMRYVERGLGVDMGELKNEILSRLGHPPSLVDGKFPMGDGGLVAVVKLNRIVTIQRGN